MTSANPTSPANAGPMIDKGAGVVRVRPAGATTTVQALPYWLGVSGRNAGSRRLCMHRVVIPPGGRAAPHRHLGYETAIYVVSGAVETQYGRGLAERIVTEAGDFLYIDAGVPHAAVNLSATEAAVAIVARDIADEEDRVETYDPEADRG